LFVADNSTFDQGTLDGWTLTLTGQPESQDDTYIFTNEYAETLAAESTRGTLTDPGGIDTLNAAALTAAMIIDLAPGATSMIDGADLVISASTIIEHAIGGDGGDTIRGNASPNALRGMRGDDTLDGGSGIDIAVYRGRSADYIIGEAGAAGRSLHDTMAGRDGSDTLFAVERLQFSDLTIALDTAGHAGHAYALWNAAFARTPSPAEIGRWISPFDAGGGIVEAAQSFIDAYAPGISYRDEVDILYTNVVGERPGAEQMDYFTGLLERGDMTQAELFVFAAKHELNQADYVELIANGVAYVPWAA
jgi:Ca2+-binding RTX toxin-like protein